jgi:hypothetical protein
MLPLSLLGLAFDFQFWQLPDFGNSGVPSKPGFGLLGWNFGSFPASFVIQRFPLRSLRP